MPFFLTMPALSPTMTDGILVAWKKKEGDSVRVGDPIADVETDKATMEVEAAQAGTLGRILVESGPGKVSVETPLAVFLKPGENPEDIPAFLEKNPSKKISATPISEPASSPVSHTSSTPVAPSIQESIPVEAPVAVSGSCHTKSSPDHQRISALPASISPIASRLILHHGLDPRAIQGTGPKGRIVKADVEKALKEGLSQPVSRDSLSHPSDAQLFSGHEPSYVLEPVSSMRKVIADRLCLSKQIAPHFYLHADCHVDALVNLRNSLNHKEDLKLSLNDWILKACALALKRVPEMNRAWSEKGIRRYDSVSIAVAVGLPDGGLVTPVIRQAENKSLRAISQEVKQLAAEAKAKKLLPEAWQGGTITVSNLGMFGVDQFSAILNPPQACIVSVGALRRIPMVIDQTVQPGHSLSVGLSVDHRVADGLVAAHFLKTLRGFLENPESMLLE